MKLPVYDAMQVREIFHLEFLRRLTRKIKPGSYALEGGANLRFFFGSPRYSEDMDLDVQGVPVAALKETVMEILGQRMFRDVLVPFGIESVTPPDMKKAKQTETTQRFKIHLITGAGEDLFTRVEFSRRGFRGQALVQSVSSSILAAYGLSPLLVSHYDAASAILQKADALATRSVFQPRDIFDLYLLSSHGVPGAAAAVLGRGAKLRETCDKVLEVGFDRFRDAVLAYLPPDERVPYDSAAAWDEIKLKVTAFLEGPDP
jgi:hypothetical protein